MRLMDRVRKLLAPVDNSGAAGSWWPIVREPYPGAWQNDDETRTDTVVQHPTVYACITLISNDIGKLRHKLVEADNDGIWSETQAGAYSPVLRKPNRYQNHIQFKQWWIMSKLLRGNAYALKQRDSRNVVTALYLLDPCRVQPLVTESGDVYYRLQNDNLSGVTQDSITIPASEIIHDRMNCLFHPLVGTSPLFAAATVANIGLKIESNVASFFGNSSNPSGILVAPGAISDETAARLKEHWNSNYSGGSNSGKIAVVGDGLKFEAMRMSAVDSQLIEILKWSDEKVCSVYHVPGYMVGVGGAPTFNNIESLNQDYYSKCLQSLIEEYEACIDEGLGLDGWKKGIELDLDGLIRMDSEAQTKILVDQVKGSIASIDEARAKLDRKSVSGGSSIWMQQQNYSLEALAQRDANDPFAKPSPAPTPDTQPPAPTDTPPEDSADATAAKSYMATHKAIEAARLEMAA